METIAADPAADALESRCALFEERRLDVFRALVEGGPGGLAAGNIAGHCKALAPSCSFHLGEREPGSGWPRPARTRARTRVDFRF